MAVIKTVLVKRIKYEIHGLAHSVYGSVYRRVDGNHDLPYFWEISHHYRPSNEAGGVYFPSVTSAATASDAEGLLDTYARNFTNIDVTPNPDGG